MYLHAQVCRLEWQPSDKAKTVAFSVPPTQYTQSANVSFTLSYETFDQFNFQLGDLYNITFRKIKVDEAEANDIATRQCVVLLNKHDTWLWYVGSPSEKRMSYLQFFSVRGPHLKSATVLVTVDTELVEGEQQGDYFVVEFRKVEEDNERA